MLRYEKMSIGSAKKNKITKKPKKVDIICKEVKAYVLEYKCPHCHTTFVGADVPEKVTQFLCKCGQELVVENRKYIKEKSE